MYFPIQAHNLASQLLKTDKKKNLKMKYLKGASRISQSTFESQLEFWRWATGQDGWLIIKFLKLNVGHFMSALS